MPTVTVSTTLLQALKITLVDGEDVPFELKRVLEPLLASRGFRIHGPVRASAVADGFVLTQ